MSFYMHPVIYSYKTSVKLGHDLFACPKNHHLWNATHRYDDGVFVYTKEDVEDIRKYIHLPTLFTKSMFYYFEGLPNYEIFFNALCHAFPGLFDPSLTSQHYLVSSTYIEEARTIVFGFKNDKLWTTKRASEKLYSIYFQ